MMDWTRMEEVLDTLKIMRIFGILAEVTVLTTLNCFISKSKKINSL